MSMEEVYVVNNMSMCMVAGRKALSLQHCHNIRLLLEDVYGV